MSGAAGRGRPLIFLGLLLGSWTLARAALWESPWPEAAPPVTAIASSASRQGSAPPVPVVRSDPRAAHALLAPPAMLQAVPTPRFVRPAGTEPFAAAPSGILLAAIAGYSLPPIPSSAGEAAARRRDELHAVQRGKPSRWRFDTWLFLREGSGAAAAAARTPLYGASQVGAVAAFRLAPTSPRQPEAYARLSKALIEGGESEAALGLRLDPVSVLPITLHAEARVTERDGRFELRPSAFVTAGFEERALPGGMALRGYGQAGYVGGRHASGFADGMIAADRALAEVGTAELRLGAGAWGGAQRGTARLDVGPTVSLALPVAGAPVRLSADYRIRVAGDAAPGGGAALTLSTGF